MLTQDKGTLQVLRNTLIVYSIFRHEVQESKNAAAKPDAPKAEAEKIEVIAVIEQELGEFYEDARMAEHMDLVNDAMSILTRTQLTENIKELLENLVCIFEAHLPELEQVFK